jgi:putative ABC transport system permease protein
MRRTRWSKVLGDMKVNRRRLAMMAAAVGISLFGIGTIMSAYAILTREIRGNYMGTNPASATFELGQVSDELVQEVGRMPGIASVEARASVLSRVRAGNRDWQPLLLFAVRDFAAMRVGVSYPNSGAWPPPHGTFLAERTALAVLGVKEGDVVEVKTPGGPQRTMTVSGTVHDPGLAPAWQERMGYGYITAATLEWLGERTGLDELKVVFTAAQDEASVTRQAVALGQWLLARGHHVREVQIPPPGRHPHQGQMSAILILLFIFAVLALLLSAILVAAMIGSLMAREVRSIGIMKAVGGDTPQIAAIYVALVFAVSAAAIVVGVPLGVLAGSALAGTVASLLNFTIESSAIPAWVFLVQAASGLAVPLALSLLPILRASRMTVRQATGYVGAAAPRVRTARGRPWGARLSRPARALALALSNTLRRRGRLAMTLTLLAAGGAMFMSALSTNDAWFVTLSDSYKSRRYDFEIRLGMPIPAGDLAAKLSAVPGMDAVEPWGFEPASPMTASDIGITRAYPDGGHGSFSLRGVPEGSRAVDFPLMSGRWLAPGDTDAVVLNQLAGPLFPGAGVGGTITFTAAGRSTRWRIVGMVREIGAASAYVSEAGFEQALSLRGLARSFRLTAREHTPEARGAMIKAVDRLLESSGIGVSVVVPDAEYRNAVSDHIAILIFALVAMAVLMGTVGVLGLAASTGTGVIERTREFGVMRALGATPALIVRNVILEALATGLSSWLIALALSVPLSFLTGQVLGSLSFRIPLTLVISGTGAWVWGALVAAGSVAASAAPAARASRLSVRETLAYE